MQTNSNKIVPKVIVSIAVGVLLSALLVIAPMQNVSARGVNADGKVDLPKQIVWSRDNRLFRSYVAIRRAAAGVNFPSSNLATMPHELFVKISPTISDDPNQFLWLIQTGFPFRCSYLIRDINVDAGTETVAEVYVVRFSQYSFFIPKHMDWWLLGNVAAWSVFVILLWKSWGYLWMSPRPQAV